MSVWVNRQRDETPDTIIFPLSPLLHRIRFLHLLILVSLNVPHPTVSACEKTTKQKKRRDSLSDRSSNNTAAQVVKWQKMCERTSFRGYVVSSLYVVGSKPTDPTYVSSSESGLLAKNRRLSTRPSGHRIRSNATGWVHVESGSSGSKLASDNRIAYSDIIARVHNKCGRNSVNALATNSNTCVINIYWNLKYKNQIWFLQRQHDENKTEMRQIICHLWNLVDYLQQDRIKLCRIS